MSIRFGQILRSLGKSPGYLAASITTLALGIGVSSAVYALVGGVLGKGLEYQRPEQLVSIRSDLRQTSLEDADATPAEFAAYLDAGGQAVDSLAAYTWKGMNLSGLEQPRRVVGALVSGDFFRVMGSAALHGRTLTVADDVSGAGRVVVISHDLWRQSFGSDASLVGRSIRLDGQSHVVVGIMPERFQFPFRHIAIWRSTAFGEEGLRDLETRDLGLVARLSDLSAMSRAETEFNRAAAELSAAHPSHYPNGLRLRLVSLRESIVGDARPFLLILAGAVFFVFLIVCSNVAGLMLARISARSGEMAVRAALGAGRSGLSLRWLLEGLFLAVCGCPMGLLLAWAAVTAVKAAQPFGIPRLDEVFIDGRVVLMTLGFTLLAGCVLGLLTSFRVSGIQLIGSLRAGHGFKTGTSSLWRSLVVAQTAMAVVLLVSGGLMTRSFLLLRDVDPGYRTGGLLTARIVLPSAKYEWFAPRRAFFEQLLAKTAALPGVEAAASVSALPLSDVRIQRGFALEPSEGRQSQVPLTADYVVVSPGYFEVMGIGLARGRYLRPSDSRAGPPKVLINESMAAMGWPGEDPVGKRLKIGRRASRFPWMQVAGVVRDVKQNSVDADSRPEVYVSYRRRGLLLHPVGAMFLVARTSGHPLDLVPGIRREVLSLDAEQPLVNVATMSQRLHDSISQQRFNAWTLGIFAACGLILAAVGLYALIAYSASRRFHEIGVRRAFGARPSDVVRLVIGQGMRLTSLGVLLGLALSIGLGRLLSSQLFNLSSLDLWTHASIAAVLLVVGLAASYLPASRAARVDPIQAIRYD